MGSGASRAVAVIALLGSCFVLSGCAEANASSVATSSESSSPAPSPEPERYEGSDFERTTPLPANLEYLNDISDPIEFVKQPLADRVAWATWADQYIQEYAQYFYSVTGDSTDAPYTVTADNFLSQLSDRQYQLRIAENFGTGTPANPDTNGVLDRVFIKKYLLAFTVGPPAIEDVDRTIASFGQEGQALNVVLAASIGRNSLVQYALEASDLTTTLETVTVDGVQYAGTRFSFTRGETNTLYSGVYILVGNRTVLVTE